MAPEKEVSAFTTGVVSPAVIWLGASLVYEGLSMAPPICHGSSHQLDAALLLCLGRRKLSYLHAKMLLASRKR